MATRRAARAAAAERPAAARSDDDPFVPLPPGPVPLFVRSPAGLRFGLDLLFLGAATLAAFPLRFTLGLLEVTEDAPFDATAHLVASVLWMGSVLAAMGSQRLYDEDTLVPGGGELSRVGRALLQGIAVVSVAVFLLRFVTVSRGWFILVVVLSLASLAVERWAVRRTLRRLRARGRARRPAVLVTRDGRSGRGVPEGDEFQVLGVVSAANVPGLIAGWRQAGTLVPALILSGNAVDDEGLWDLVLRAGEAGAPVFVRSSMQSVHTDRLTTRELDGRTIVKVAPPALTGARAVTKRALDVVLAAIGLALFAIPMLIVAIAVLVSSGLPVFFRQERIGRGGRPFTMWKFRTMRRDAEDESGAVWATRDDPRRTGIGRFLRRFGLDELPQLWNVLRGDMSIVGPRPERDVFVEAFAGESEYYGYRHRMRPGITGLAQVRGLRGASAVEPRTEADNWYIEHWSLVLDLRIIAGTLGEILRGRGAT